MLKTLEEFLLKLGLNKTFWVAFSGGLDSHVLLKLCHTLREQFPIQLKAIHVNHGISHQADEWAESATIICKSLSIPLIVEKIPIVLPHQNIEENARHARYQILAKYIEANDVLLTAHHQDDQIETVLLQLLRGSGPKGLAAMPALKTFSKGMLARPLLSFPRSQLETYARTQGFTWIEDESNQDCRLKRNFIRHHIIPSLLKQYPGLYASLSRSASHCAEAQLLLEEFSLTDCKKLEGSKPNTLSLRKLLLLSEAHQRLVLRTWIQSQHYPLPNMKKLYSIQNTLLTAKQDRSPFVIWQSVMMRRFKDNLYLLSYPLPEKQKPIGKLMKGAGIKNHPEIAIRFREGGERVEFPEGRRSLKNLFQEYEIPPWERPFVPLVYVDNRLIALLGYYTHPEYVAGREDMGWVFA